MNKTLHYDDSKDLYEGLITESNDGTQSQVAQVFPSFREEYGYKFAAAPDMYEAIKFATTELHSNRWEQSWSKVMQKLEQALAKAEGK